MVVSAGDRDYLPTKIIQWRICKTSHVLPATATVESVAIARGELRARNRGEWCLNVCGDKRVLAHRDVSIDDGISTIDDALRWLR